MHLYYRIILNHCPDRCGARCPWSPQSRDINIFDYILQVFSRSMSIASVLKLSQIWRVYYVHSPKILVPVSWGGHSIMSCVHTVLFVGTVRTYGARSEVKRTVCQWCVHWPPTTQPITLMQPTLVLLMSKQMLVLVHILRWSVAVRHYAERNVPSFKLRLLYLLGMNPKYHWIKGLYWQWTLCGCCEEDKTFLP
jgi:hypothetical protein